MKNGLTKTIVVLSQLIYEHRFRKLDMRVYYQLFYAFLLDNLKASSISNNENHLISS